MTTLSSLRVTMTSVRAKLASWRFSVLSEFLDKNVNNTIWNILYKYNLFAEHHKRQVDTIPVKCWLHPMQLRRQASDVITLLRGQTLHFIVQLNFPICQKEPMQQMFLGWIRKYISETILHNAASDGEQQSVKRRFPKSLHMVAKNVTKPTPLPNNWIRISTCRAI